MARTEQMNERQSACRTRSCIGLAAGLLVVAAGLSAQTTSWPTKPVRFIVANGAGGGLDVVARLTSPAVASALSQQLIVDNRPGAAGSVAAELTAKAAPDGYTMLMGSIGNLAVNPHLYKGLGYDPTRDLDPVTFAVSGSNVLVVHSSVPVGSVKELIALAKSKPDGLTYGSSGAGNAGHLAAELLSSMAKIKMVHVAYKGGAPAMTALLSNETQLIFASPSTAIPQVKAGRVKGLAVTTAKRSVMLPDLPTMAESGLPGYECDNWYGIAVTAHTPRPVVDRLNKEFGRALLTPEIREALLRQGLEAAPGTPEAFGKYMKSEYQKWGQLIRQMNIRGE
jgi:tripartite-type tricarboxylate transporter receptor subunit TctC